MVGSSSAIGIGVGMFLRDQFSGPARTIKANAKDLRKEVMEWEKSQLRTVRNINAAWAMTGAAAIRGMAQWTQVGAKFGYTMKFVEAVTKKAGPVTHAELLKLDAMALKLGRSTMFTAQQVASAEHFMAKAGMSANEIITGLKSTVDLAGATGTALGGVGGAADIMTNIMRAFDIPTSQSKRISDILVTATNAANVTLPMLGESTKYAANTLHQLNVGLEDTAAMFMLMGNAGIQGSMAGTSVDNSFRYLSKTLTDFSTGRQSKALKILGLGIDDLKTKSGELKPVADIFKIIGQQAQGLGTLEKQGIVEAIFGVRGKRNALMMINSMANYDKLLKKVKEDSPGEAARLMSEMMSSLQGNIMEATSAIETFKVAFTKGIEPVLKPALKLFTGIMDVLVGIINTPIIGPGLVTMVGSWVAIKTAATAYKAVKAGLRLITMSNQSAFSGRVRSTIAGYAQMSAAAKSYGMTSGAMSMAGMSPRMAGMARYGSFGGALRARGVQSVTPMSTRAGMRYMARFAGGGAGFASKTMATQARWMSMYGSKLGMTARVGSKLVGPLSKMAPLLGRTLGFLGGPWGMAISFLLPSAISLLTDSIGKNTKAQEEETRRKQLSIPKGAYTYQSDFDYRKTDDIKTYKAMGDVVAVARDMVEVFEKGAFAQDYGFKQKRQNGDLILMMPDGETIFRAPIDNLFQGSLDQALGNITE